MDYLLSIIIPTKNRYVYLKECIKTIISLASDEIEIVVQDNTIDNYEIVSFLEGLSWPHIKYFHEKQSLSQTENSDLALRNATGEYVCYIGDDDTITDMMIEVVRWAYKNEIESCIFPVAIYYWPDVVFKFFKYPTLSYTQKKPRIRKIDAKEELFKSLKEGASSLKKMPKVYHGIVQKKLLDEILKKTGSYFPGPSPDMANATSLAVIVKKHLWIEVPLMVSGYSFKSAGGMGTRGLHKARIKDVEQLAEDTELKWEKNIPKIWLASTIWAESCTKALRAMDKELLIENINWRYLYAQILVYNKEYYDETIECIPTLGDRIITFFLFCLIFLQRAYKFILNFGMTKLRITNKKIYYDVKSIEEAMSIINQHNNEINFFSIIDQVDNKLNL